ncbi:MAG: cell division protein FtsW [Acidobacteria bacterium RIFCSPLOWO2_12_FULL_54_10]|nr:MAG: cell division protein FtsW [Acidobacteria bacterium RIFCSPLOWO2_12_FULL_54_10]
MASRFTVDHKLFGVTLALVFGGLLMVYSSSAALSADRYGSAEMIFLRQLAWVIFGMIGMWVMMRVDYHWLKHPAVLFPAISISLALLAAVLLVDKVQQTNRWFRWGPLSFQPSELAKIVLVIFLAYWIEKRGEKIDDLLQTVIPAVVLVGGAAGLILLERDLGTPLVIGLVAATLFFIAGMRYQYFLGLILAAIPFLYLMIFRVSYRRDRILAFLDPYADPLGVGFQTIQSMIAVGTGGVTGLGLMNGKQKLFFLPEPFTDFIFAVTAEETGLIGAGLVVVLFGIFLWRGWEASLNAPDDFGRYLAAGLTLMVIYQAFINMSVTLGMLPPKGFPLPFLSYGGSSMVFALMSAGILLNISRHGAWGRKLRTLESQA